MGGCYSKRATKAALKKKHRMERRTNNKAQRGSGGKRAGGVAAGGVGGGAGGSGGSLTPPNTHRGRVMKGGLLKEDTKKITATATTTATTAATTTGLVTPVTRTRSVSRGSNGGGVNSPRGAYKPSSVAPAPSRPSSRPGSLNRFGFRAAGRVKAGDSTDSVNSILSDVQTNSDSTPDLCDICDLENGNVAGQGNAGKQHSQQQHSQQQHSQQQHYSQQPQNTGQQEGSDSQRTETKLHPGVVSAGSSPTPSARLTATTRNLPKPQIVTVKSLKLNSYSPSYHYNQQQQQCNETQARVLPLRPSPRFSRDSESSSKSTTEADSGLGSSSESDRLVREELGDTDTLGSQNLDLPDDVSEVWLREKRGGAMEAGRGSAGNIPAHGSLELGFRGSFEVKRKGFEVKVNPSLTPQRNMSGFVASQTSVLNSPPERTARGGKEKRDGQITYGMARQKFAPYSRNRFGYYHSSHYQAKMTTTNTTTNTNVTTTDRIAGKNSDGVNCKVINADKSLPNTKPKVPKPASPPSKIQGQVNAKSPPSAHKSPQNATRSPPNTHTKSQVTKTHNNKSPPSQKQTPNTSTKSPPVGLVKSRIAMLETTPHVMSAGKKSPPQVPNRKIASKKPITRPTSLEKSPLVIPVSERNVEISKPVFRRLEYSEGTAEYETPIQSKLTAEDILIVGSVETETEGLDVKMDVKRMLKMIPDSVIPYTEVTKGSKDAKETEKLVMETSTETSLTSIKSSQNSASVQSPNSLSDDLKLLTPQSESSFEILESLSETLDLTLEDNIKEDSSDIQEMISSSELPPEVPPPRTTPVHAHRHNAHSHAHAHRLGANAGSPTDHRRPLRQMLSVLKSESRSSTESESQKSDANCDHNSNLQSSALTNSSSGHSGTCTPVLTSGRDLDLDFLIDDEISDQPGLTFGDDAGGRLTSSFFGDDEFDDLVAAVAIGGSETGSPAHVLGNVGGDVRRRARTDSLDTTSSSLAGDDLMLDYETHEARMTDAGYEEEVMSPDASEIFNEWTAMMTEMGATERCQSQSSCASSGSRVIRARQGSLSDLVTSERRPMVLRPPRQGSVSESDVGSVSGGSGGSSGGGGSGGVFIDRTTYHYMYQDVTALKTMLLRLRRILHAADTVNPFDANLRNSLYLSLASSEAAGLNGDKDCFTPTPAQVSQENVDLRRQVVLLQQQLEDKDRTIRLLQQQLSQSLTLHHNNHNPQQQQPPTTTTTTTATAAATSTRGTNAATQTERLARAPLSTSSLSRAASIDDGLGPTVSSKDMERQRSSSSPTESSYQFAHSSSQQLQQQQQQQQLQQQQPSHHHKHLYL